MQGLLLFLFSIGVDSTAHGSAPLVADYPQDVPYSLEVVHHPRFPLRKTHGFELNGQNLYGDKFLTSLGLSLGYRYFLSDRWGIGLEMGVFTHSVASEAFQLTQMGVPPRMNNPNMMLKLMVLYQPIYGKFVLANHIQHFHWGFLLGAHAANEAPMLMTGVEEVSARVLFGPSLGTQILFPIVNKFSAQLRVDFHLHGKLFASEQGTFRHLWTYSLGLGYSL